VLDPEGYTALMRAVEQQCLPLVQRLVVQQSDEILTDTNVSLPALQDATALSMAATGSAEIVSALCQFLTATMANARSGCVVLFVLLALLVLALFVVVLVVLLPPPCCCCVTAVVVAALLLLLLYCCAGLSVCMSVSVSVCWSVGLSACLWSVCRSVCQSVSRCVSQSVSQSVSQLVGHSVSLLSVCLPVSLSVGLSFACFRRPHYRTPIMLAAVGGHLEVVDALLNFEDVDLNAEDANGKTAAVLALEHGHTGVAELLQTVDDEGGGDGGDGDEGEEER
jgi:hypothetical protein